MFKSKNIYLSLLPCAAIYAVVGGVALDCSIYSHQNLFVGSLLILFWANLADAKKRERWQNNGRK